MKDVNNDIEVEGSEDYKGISEIGFRGIIMEQYRRCCVEGSKEMPSSPLLPAGPPMSQNLDRLDRETESPA